MKKLTKPLTCLIFAMILASCATLTNPTTQNEKTRALQWCNGAEWVLGITDLMAPVACAAIKQQQAEQVSGQVWTAVACMTYQLSSTQLRARIQEVRSLARTEAPPAEIAAALQEAQKTYSKIDEVYQGEPIPVVQPVPPGAMNLFLDSTRTTLAIRPCPPPVAYGIQCPGQFAS